VPELEIHHEVAHENDPIGKRIGVLAAILAVALALTTIVAHRTHNQAIVLKTEANDQWQFYQSKRMKFHNLELGQDLIAALGAREEAAEKVLTRYEKEKARYEKEGEEIQQEAKRTESEVSRAERRGLRYDVGEGMLEISLILTSLYFISRKKYFPLIGLVAGLGGAVVTATGLFL
jgi:predicted amidohydrolase